MASRSAMSAPQVEQVRRRADGYLTNPLLVEATGRDFVWHFRYSGPDGVLNSPDDISTGDALYLPSDHDIHLVVHSEDYIYFLSVPELNLRQVAVPDLTFEKAFHTEEEGEFEIPPDLMCGMRSFHGRRMGRVVVQQTSSFIDSLSEFATSSFEPYPENDSSSR